MTTSPKKPRSKNKVVRVENNGDYVVVQFVREDGEVCIGEYKRIGWAWAPQAHREDVMARLQLPPVNVVVTGRRK